MMIEFGESSQQMLDEIDLMIFGENNGFFAKIILDSISPEGERLTTFHLRYPRMVHSEFMTHREVSRNGRSSRAVPTKTLLKEDTYTPVFKKNKKGMQPGEKFGSVENRAASFVWHNAVNSCKRSAQKLNDTNCTKELSNRMVEWFGYIDVLATSSNWKHFLNLRMHPDAQAEIRTIALLMNEALGNSKPNILNYGEWHLPYVDEKEGLSLELAQQVSVARCARISYKPFDSDTVDVNKDILLCQRLKTADPMHASPFEHQATPDKPANWFVKKITNGYMQWKNQKLNGNLNGWIQYRKLIDGEYTG